MKTIVTLATTVALLTAGAASRAATPVAEPGALTRIDRAFAEGRIDSPTRALYGLYLVKAPEKLPVDLRPAPGEAKPRCATPLFHRAWMEREAFSPEQYAEYLAATQRPALSNEATVNAPVNAIIVHYDSVADPGGTFANIVAAFADTAFNVEITSMGWLPPIDDTVGGASGAGSPDLDIYLQAGAAVAYTAAETANPNTPISDASTFIVIDPSFTDIETYVAHEFNHSSQYAYDSKEADSLYEMTAVFMEDAVYPAVNNYLPYVADFQNHPERNLSWATYDDQYMYGASMFLRWLSDRYGSGTTTIVRSIWENSEQNDTTNTKTYFQALDGTVLPAAGVTGGLQAAVQEFSGDRYLVGATLPTTWSPEAVNWPPVAPIQSFTISNGTDGNTTPNAPQPLGVNYVEVDPAGGVAGDKLTFTLHGGSGVSWGVTTVSVATGNASATVVASPVDSGDGEVRVAVSGLDGFSKLVFAVTNLGTAGQAPDSLDTAQPPNHVGPVTPTSFTYDVFYSATGADPAAKASSCKCSLSSTRTHAAVPGSLLLALGGLAATGFVRRRS